MTPQIIISSLAVIAGIFYFSFPFINKKFFQRPKLTLEIVQNKGITGGIQHLQYFPEDINLPVNRPEVVSLYNLFWKFDLVIRNNSEYDAYNIELFNKGIEVGYLKFNSKVNPNKPLPKHAEVSIPFEYETKRIIQLQNIQKVNLNEVDEFRDFEILINYRNSKNNRFNTTLKFKNREIKFDKISKKEITKKWR